MAKFRKRLMIQVNVASRLLALRFLQDFLSQTQFQKGFIANSCFPLHRDLHRYSNAALFIRQTLDTRQFPLHHPQ